MRILILCTGNSCRSHVPTHVNTYLGQEWNYAITVCGGARDTIKEAFTQFYLTEIKHSAIHVINQRNY